MAKKQNSVKRLVPQKITLVDWSVFVGDVILDVGLGILGIGHRTLGPNRKGQFLFLFVNVWAKIRIFKALEWPSSAFVLEVMT